MAEEKESNGSSRKMIIDDPDDPDYLKINRAYFADHLVKVQKLLNERNLTVDQLTEIGSDFNQVKEFMLLLDSQFGFFESLKSGKPISPYKMAGKLISTTLEFKNNPDKYKLKEHGTNLNRIIKKVTDGKYILNQPGRTAIPATTINGTIGTGYEQPEPKHVKRNWFQRGFDRVRGFVGR